MSAVNHFNIVIQPTEVKYFHEPLKLLLSALNKLNFAASMSHEFKKDYINIAFSPHAGITNWRMIKENINKNNLIVFNFEPITRIHTLRFTKEYLSIMVNAHVWDYNEDNVHKLKKMGIADAHHLPIAFDESLIFANPGIEEQDIDVLFYGSYNSYRSQIIDAIAAMGLRVATNNGQEISEEEKQSLIKRSKLFLNLHAFDINEVKDETYPFESVRTCLALANRKAVVSVTYPNTSIEPLVAEKRRQLLSAM